MSASIPAYCPTCQKLFESKAFALGTGASVNLKGVITSCPFGHDAHFLDGTYALRDNLLHLASSSPETLATIRQIAERAIAGKTKPDDAIADILELHPALAPALKNGKQSSSIALLALLIYLAVEMTKIGASLVQGPSTVVTNGPTIINNFPLVKRVSEDAHFSPSTSSIQDDYGHYSKRKKRRLRGRAKEEARKLRD